MSVTIYNCKRCKLGVRVDYPIRYSNGYRSTYFRKDERGQQVSQGVWIQSSGGGKPTVYGGDPLGVCTGCGKMMSFGQLVGTRNDSVPCDGRCTGARGHSCDCSCGGKNHGAGWQMGRPMSAVLELQAQ